MKSTTRWFSERLQQHVSLARWGHFGTPVLVFPTAGGDAEEIERMKLVYVCEELLESGRIKIYSVDSVAGRAMVGAEGSPAYRMRLMNFFHDFVRNEVVPAIVSDCGGAELGIISTGSSIGAFNALAMVCRYPDVFHKAICMSGTYDVTRFYEGAPMTEDLYLASPLHFLPNLEGPQLDQLRERFVLLASGQGDYEDIGESWNAAHVLGSKGVPNRVDAWGVEWEHNWPTWRAMLPQYLAEFV